MSARASLLFPLAQTLLRNLSLYASKDELGCQVTATEPPRDGLSQMVLRDFVMAPAYSISRKRNTTRNTIVPAPLGIGPNTGYITSQPQYPATLLAKALGGLRIVQASIGWN